MMAITPVLLAGGSGTRLWPLSRQSYPKQFSNFFGDRTLFQEAILRLTSSKLIKFKPHITMTNSDFRFIVQEQFQELHKSAGPILIEPLARNTAPAILAACLYCIDKDPHSILFVSPTDHLIPFQNSFHETISKGLDEVRDGKIVTFGVTPTRPDTGYGYLHLSKKWNGVSYDLKGFVEKPSEETARDMVESNEFLWNSGMFMFNAMQMLESFEIFCPNLIEPVKKAINDGKIDLEFFRLESGSWSECQNISIDYAVMEKAPNIAAVPFSSDWSDLGDWKSVWEQMDPDSQKLVVSDNVHAIDCKNTLLRSESEDLQLVGLGLDNIVAVAMKDAVIVADKDRSQEVKKVVADLRGKGVSQSEAFPKVHRPWGYFEQLAVGNGFQVKRILVHPGAALSLQSHKYRSEHWVVVVGSAKVTVNAKTKVLTEGESVHIPLGVIHRLENPGKAPMILIEVQTGSYLGEDDIIRYEDRYSRD